MSAFSPAFERFAPYFRRHGLTTVAPLFYTQIAIWESWYRANVAGFHRYKVFMGRGRTQTCKRKSLGMAKKLCEDVADLLLNEKVQVTIDDEATSEYVHSTLRAANFSTKGNEYQERKAATGTVAYLPRLVGYDLTEDGDVIGGEVRIDYVTASHIFPVAWQSGTISECVFAIDTYRKDKRYTLMQAHRLEDMEYGGRQYVITNEVIDNAGNVVPSATVARLPAFAGMSPRIETGTDAPQFVIDKLAITNNTATATDEGNPMGVPIFANSLDILAKLDLEYDSYANEFTLGRKRLFVAPEMMQDENGNLVFDPADSVFYQLPEDYFKDTKEAIHEVNMSLRVTEHETAINQDLNLLSLKAGFGTQYYRFERGAVATATQVISENSDLYRTIRKHEIPLTASLQSLCRAIIRLGVAAGENLNPDAEIKVTFDDSIIEDKGAEREQDRQDVAMGVMSLAEYRAKWYGETEEEAAKRLPADQTDGTGVIV